MSDPLLAEMSSCDHAVNDSVVQKTLAAGIDVVRRVVGERPAIAIMISVSLGVMIGCLSKRR